MKINNVSNSTLGRYLSFDPSYISRIRTGKRGLPKHQPFIEPIADYFSRNLKEEYQRKLVGDAICPYRPLPDNNVAVRQLIIEWLLDDTKDIEQINVSAEDENNSLSGGIDDKSFFYGNKGKRQAVVKFFEDICKLGKPMNLMFYTDEEMSWFCEDETFPAYWTKLLMKIVELGGKIKIIHSFGRGISDMLEILRTWIPVYMSGNVEPYYYPKLRDGIYHRTLFIAQGYSALVSTSVGNKTDDAMNLLLEDKTAVYAVENEFMNYLSMCKPLMNIYNVYNSNALASKMRLAKDMRGNFIVSGTVPSLYTMPDTLADKMSKRTNGKRFKEIYTQHREWFKSLLDDGNMVTELISFNDINDGAKKYVPMCDVFRLDKLSYENDELAEHLSNVIKLLDTYPNYRVIITDSIIGDMSLLALEDYGIIIAGVKSPATIFEITEQSIRLTFWEYLMRTADDKEKNCDMYASIKKYIDYYSINN